MSMVVLLFGKTAPFVLKRHLQSDSSRTAAKKTSKWSFSLHLTAHNDKGSVSSDKEKKINDDSNKHQSNSNEARNRMSVGGQKKRIVFLGTPDVAASTLRVLHERSIQPDSPFEISAVVTQPPRRRRRGGAMESSPVGKVAEALRADDGSAPLLLFPEKMTGDTVFLDQLQFDIRPDLCITAAYGQYLPKRFLGIPPLGTVNIHPSLLPRWRGASPVQRSLEAGDNPVGVTLLYTVSKMDAGPIIAQKELHLPTTSAALVMPSSGGLVETDTPADTLSTVVVCDDTATTVLPKLFEMGTDLLLSLLPELLTGNVTFSDARPQDEYSISLAKMIDPEEAEFRVWRESALTCHNRLRGFSMWPQAFMWLQVFEPPTEAKGSEHTDSDHGDPLGLVPVTEPIRVKITKTRVVSVSTSSNPTPSMDRVLKLGPSKRSGLYVTCYDGSVLELLQVQPATRKEFPARDFQNGYPGKIIMWMDPASPDASVPYEPSTIAKSTTRAQQIQ